MTTTPVLGAALDRVIADLRSMLACAEDWAGDLYEGRRLAEEWNPALQNVYGGQDIAVEEADAVAADLRRQLERAELAQAQAHKAAPGGAGENGETR